MLGDLDHTIGIVINIEEQGVKAHGIPTNAF
jgi:hypothetical protein